MLCSNRSKRWVSLALCVASILSGVVALALFLRSETGVVTQIGERNDDCTYDRHYYVGQEPFTSKTMIDYLQHSYQSEITISYEVDSNGREIDGDGEISNHRFYQWYSSST